ncbi:unnamed protein product [Diatraea saccharalis]|uniref:Pigment dispersing factor n=1 Tax=Diatraea saccharalis TaxID=40085 RepID=A0A9N9QUP1_9NEOP|nr:unnamed protein product [Diatraea saccharalis]
MVSALIYIAFFILLTILPQASFEAPDDYDYESLSNGAQELPEDTHPDDEYVRRIHSMIDSYRSSINGRMVIESNALINTKYRIWKRNADLINSLLALPKDMNDVGRR